MRTCGQSKRSLFQRNTIVGYIKQLHIWLHFFLTFHPSCRDIFGAICLVTLTQRFGELSRLRENIFTRLLTQWVPRSESHDSRLFSEPSLSPLALIAHLRLTVPSTRRFGARSKRAQLTSPVLTAVDRAPCSPTPSGAFIAVTSSTAHLARTPGAPFSPPSLLRTCREAIREVRIHSSIHRHISPVRVARNLKSVQIAL